ncbi:hypothetical protein BDV29DRAFT_202271 [Aspergillus leporis]|uniref:Uncharacterized protein n=1 Tax=Aspergillus leporis TaxID=41062 RepID=A0A5N5WVA3_9EURO|nr:hypothetical protein BDV29DRAFT_202271 [Aspergillus leporis]
MRWSTLLPLSLSAITLLPSAGAWEFTWRDASNTTHVESGRGPSSCITVEHEKGKLFAIDAKGEKNINMLLYGTDDCSGKSVGKATEYFSKESSVAIHGFRVESLAGGSNSTNTASNATITSTTPSHAPSASISESSQATTSTSTSAENESGTTASTTGASETSTSTPNASLRLSISDIDMVKTAVGMVLGLAAVQWLN